MSKGHRKLKEMLLHDIVAKHFVKNDNSDKNKKNNKVGKKE